MSFNDDKFYVFFQICKNNLFVKFSLNNHIIISF